MASVHSLGQLLDLGLPLDSQVAPVASSTYCQLQLVHQLHPYLVKKEVAVVIHALWSLHSLLDHAL